MTAPITNLSQMLDRVEESVGNGSGVSLGKVVEILGQRSFGPLLLLAGIVLASPVSGIPGVPTSMGILVLLIAGQLLFRRNYFWLPVWLLRRSISSRYLGTALRWLRPPARLVDRFLRPRIAVFTRGASMYAIAVICVVIAAGLPLMELVPFSAHAAGIALSAFGLSMIAHDGLLALLAFLITVIAFAPVVWKLLD